MTEQSYPDSDETTGNKISIIRRRRNGANMQLLEMNPPHWFETSMDSNMVFDFGELRFLDSFYFLNIFDRVETTILISIVNDCLSFGWANSWKSIQLLKSGRVEVHCLPGRQFA